MVPGVGSSIEQNENKGDLLLIVGVPTTSSTSLILFLSVGTLNRFSV